MSKMSSVVCTKCKGCKSAKGKPCSVCAGTGLSNKSMAKGVEK